VYLLGFLVSATVPDGTASRHRGRGPHDGPRRPNVVGPNFVITIAA
jgi:hypothetical protein